MNYGFLEEWEGMVGNKFHLKNFISVFLILFIVNFMKEEEHATKILVKDFGFHIAKYILKISCFSAKSAS